MKCKTFSIIEKLKYYYFIIFVNELKHQTNVGRALMKRWNFYEVLNLWCLGYCCCYCWSFDATIIIIILRRSINYIRNHLKKGTQRWSLTIYQRIQLTASMWWSRYKRPALKSTHKSALLVIWSLIQVFSFLELKIQMKCSLF